VKDGEGVATNIACIHTQFTKAHYSLLLATRSVLPRGYLAAPHRAQIMSAQEALHDDVGDPGVAPSQVARPPCPICQPHVPARALISQPASL